MNKITNKQKALIHVAKARCGMSEIEYRDMLLSFGVSSSADLTDKKFDAVMEHFKKLGFKNNFKRKSSKQMLLAKIKAIIADMELTEAYIDGMSRHMFRNDDGEPVASYRWLNADQLRRLVAALMYHQKRSKAQG